MEIKYSAHAVTRMLERKITPDEVQQVIFEPDGVIEQSAYKKIFFRSFKKRKDNNVAAVVVEEKHDHFEVITVMINFEVLK